MFILHLLTATEQRQQYLTQYFLCNNHNKQIIIIKRLSIGPIVAFFLSALVTHLCAVVQFRCAGRLKIKMPVSKEIECLCDVQASVSVCARACVLYRSLFFSHLSSSVFSCCTRSSRGMHIEEYVAARFSMQITSIIDESNYKW